MSAVAVLGAAAVAVACAAVARAICPPTTRLGPRLRPYLVALPGRERGAAIAAVALSAGPARPFGGSTLGRLFGPPAVATLRRLGGMLERRSDANLERLLWQAGRPDMTADEYRVRQAVRGVVVGGAAGFATVVVVHVPLVVLATAVAGFVVGTTGWRRRFETVVAGRTALLPHELYTVNQLLALHLRTGA